ncbi:glycosyltransferase family 4 protein [Anaerosacchariphilus polymeriproducens]|uniref:glycosyltransferase family 4 protein n=1 Tax=Anaerosacchariphilus polymeriproducens TaxID=1812858 RepID=UPI00187B8048|nr:glycosyltransferase family 4 protein [Anaerosacchariphilus polymeriproducens]
MKVLLYTKQLKVVSKSGVGRAIEMQLDSLRKAGVDITTDVNEDYETVHVNTIFPSDYFMAKKAKQKGKAVVYHAHSTKEDFCNSFKGSNLIAPFFQKWIMKCYQLGDVILTPTEYSKSLLEGYGIKKPIIPISNGIDTQFYKKDLKKRKLFREHYNIDENRKIIMSVGLYFDRKGILDFIELAKRMPEYTFFWFGFTPYYQIPGNIKRAIEHSPSNLILPGYVSKEEIIMAYNGCDLFLFPSKEETEGIVVLEALAAQIPVLIRDIPVYSHWLKKEEDVYKASDIEEFQSLAKKILENKIKNLTLNGYQRAIERDSRLQAEKLKMIYERVGEDAKIYYGGGNNE